MILSAYIAKDGLLSLLLKELNDVDAIVKENLVLSTKPFCNLFFMQNGWQDVETIRISSIQDGIKELKKRHPFWSFYPIGLHRRGELISQGLRKQSNEPIFYQSPLPKYKCGGFTLLDQNTIIASKNTTSFYPHGKINLIEDKTPPSRAYLKLLEVLHLLQKFPKPQDKCLELGASPGSWTYILGQLSNNVIACDRAPLDPKVSKLTTIHHVQGDAFKLTPDKVGPIDWLFSDLICYPDKLLEFLDLWIASNLCKNFICTIKLQGDVDFSVLERFKTIPQSKIMHLFNNKHELTFVLLES